MDGGIGVWLLYSMKYGVVQLQLHLDVEIFRFSFSLCVFWSGYSFFFGIFSIESFIESHCYV